MAVSVFDLFTIGIGPSSSHTVGPMRAARQFVHALQAAGDLARITRVDVHLYGSLAATGRGHGTHKALMLGLEGETAEETDVDRLPARIAAITADRRLNLLGQHPIHFDPDQDLVFERRERLPGHPNGMRFVAFADHAVVEERVYYSVGGGFVATAGDDGQPVLAERETPLPLPFSTGRELLALCGHHKLAISDVMLRAECPWRPEADVRAGLLRIWEAMQACVRRGCEREGQLPGLKLERRAAALHRQLSRQPDAIQRDPLTVIDWVNLFALAVNEENAMGGRVVTAPTNGAAGIIPAVLHYYARFCEGANDEGVVRFLLTAGAIGLLFKANASISGAEVGCPGGGGIGLLDGRGGAYRGARRFTGPGGERGGDRDGAQPRPHVRSGRRAGADPLHRAQRHGFGGGDQCLPPRAPRHRTPLRLPRQGDPDHARHRPRHAGEVQGNLPGRPGDACRQRPGQLHRVLVALVRPAAILLS